MKIGEVCFLTRDVVRLADFYKELLGVENGSDDEVHQTLLAEETMLTVLLDEAAESSSHPGICLAFTVEDLDRYYGKVVAMGAEILQPPTARPWGVINMSFLDPDRNTIYLRQFAG